MPSTVPAGKKGLRTYLRTIPGLTPADKVVIRGAAVAPDELAAEQITLGDVSAPQEWHRGLGIQRKQETPTVTCWIAITKPGADDAAEDAARDRAYQLLALVEDALFADPSVGGTVPQPRPTTVSNVDLEETPVDWEGAAARRAQIRFQITWTSHIVP